jgi:hypothetical protein
LEQESFLVKSPLRKPVSSPGNKHELEPKKRRKKKGSFFTKKQRKEASKTPDAKEKTDGMSSATKNQRSMPSDVAKEKTESTLSSATGPGGKKRKSANEPADAKKHRSLNSSLASKEQKTGKPSSAVKKQKTEKSTATAKARKAENAGSATKKQKTESSSSTEKLETASATLKLQVEKAVLVAVNSRRWAAARSCTRPRLALPSLHSTLNSFHIFSAKTSYAAYGRVVLAIYGVHTFHIIIPNKK